jgi:mannose-6-phosphate isomerase
MIATRPYPLAPNVIEHFYLGGERIAAMRGHAAPADPAARPGDPLRRPEEWLASTVARWGTDGSGLTELGSLGPLRELIAADPEDWLGSAHVARWGSSPALLVKLIDAGQRLPVHVHPTRQFATKHLGCPFGKTEAWVVLEVPPGGGTVFVGTTRPVRRDEWAELVNAQATDAMLDLLHPVTVNVGDGVLVPSSTPHCIDAGVFIVELQEPTDFSVLLEWEGFAIDGRADGHLGLGFDTAIDAVRTDAFSAADLDRLIRRVAPPAGHAAGNPRRLLPEDADPYFRAWAVDGMTGPTTIPEAFSVVVITGGAGTLGCDGDSSTITSGDAFVVPHAAGPLTFSAGVTAVVAQPPAPDAPEPVEQDAP